MRRAVLHRYYLNGVDAFRLKLWFPEELKRSARAAAASGAASGAVAGAPDPRGGKALLGGEKAGERRSWRRTMLRLGRRAYRLRGS